MIGLVVVGVATAVLPVVPAQASDAVGDVQFVYDAPQISEDGNHVSWHWTLQNKGADPAAHVTLLHRLNPALNGVKVSAPCEVTPTRTVRCEWDQVPAGGSEQGTIGADLPANMSGTVQISGRITWQAGAAGQQTENATGRLPGDAVSPDHS